MDKMTVHSKGQISVNLEASDKIVQPPDGNSKMDTLPTEIDGNSNRKKKKRRKHKEIVKDEGKSLDRNITNVQLANNTGEGNDIIKKFTIEDEVQSVGQIKMDTRSIKYLSEGNATVKKPKVKDDPQIFCQTEVVDTGSSKYLAEGNVTVENTEFLHNVQNTFSRTVDTGSTVKNSEGKKRKTRKKIVKAEIDDDVQNKMDAVNQAGGNVITKKPEIKDEVQDTSLTKIDRTTGNPAHGNVNIENLKMQDQSQSMSWSNLDNGPVQSFTLGIVAGKRKKKKRKKEQLVEEVQKEMDTRLTENLDEGNVSIDKPKDRDEHRSASKTQKTTGLTENFDDANDIIESPNFLNAAQSMDRQQMDTLQPSESPAQENAGVKQRKKWKKPKKEKPNDEVLSELDTRSTENPFDGDIAIWNPKTQTEVQSIDQNKMDTLQPAESPAQANVSGEQRKKRKKTMKPKVSEEVLGEIDTRSTENLFDGNFVVNPKIQDVALSMDQNKMDGLQPAEIPSRANVSEKQRKKRTKTDKVNDEVLREINTRSPENPFDGNIALLNPKIQDEGQCMDQNKMDSLQPAEIPAQANGSGVQRKKQKKNKKVKVNDEVLSEMYTRSTEIHFDGNIAIMIPKTQDEGQSTDQNKMETMQSTESPAQATVNGDQRKKRKKTKKEKVNDEVLSEMDSRSIDDPFYGNIAILNPKIQDEGQCMDQNKMDTVQPTENPAQANVSGEQRKKRKKTKKALVNKEVLGQIDTWSTENLVAGNVVILNPKIQDEAQILDQNKMDTWQSAENLSQAIVPGKLRKKRIEMKKVEFNDEGHSEMHTRSTVNLAKGNATIMTPETKVEVQIVSQNQMDTGFTENVAKGNVNRENVKSQDETQSIYQSKMDTGPTQNFAEGNVTMKRRRRKTCKANSLDEAPARMDAGSTENLAGVIVSMGISEIIDEVQNMGQKVMDAESAETLSKGSVAIEKTKNEDEAQKMDEDTMDRGPDEKRKKKQRSTKIKTNVGENKSQGGTISKDAEALYVKTAPTSIKRKLIVLDLNGLLADIVYSAPKHCIGDTKISGRQVFRRPFCEDFLKFCFENFDVGIWSSRSKHIVDKIVDYLLEDRKDKLQFCWDMTHSTQTGIKTLENCQKPLVCKELRKIWENHDPNCPWEKGDYDESNTLLLDDSPYKALLNPLHTAIFPHPYRFSHKNDNSLGPGGDLRVYLEGLVTSENVQKYVEQHPFGQKPITDRNPSWGFYKKVIEKMSNPVAGKRRSRRRRS